MIKMWELVLFGIICTVVIGIVVSLVLYIIADVNHFLTNRTQKWFKNEIQTVGIFTVSIILAIVTAGSIASIIYCFESKQNKDTSHEPKVIVVSSTGAIYDCSSLKEALLWIESEKVLPRTLTKVSVINCDVPYDFFNNFAKYNDKGEIIEVILDGYTIQDNGRSETRRK